MNYQKIYNDLIQSRKLLNREKGKGVYYEKHHIIPRCLDGDNKIDNLILLTAREHYICHWLLARIYDNYKINHAFWKMSIRKDIYKTYSVSSRAYEEARLLHAKATSIQFKGKKIEIDRDVKVAQVKKGWEVRRAKGTYKTNKGKKLIQKTKSGVPKGTPPPNKGIKGLFYNFTEEGKKNKLEASKNKTKGTIQVFKYPSMEFECEYYNRATATRELKVKNIAKVLSGERNQAGGYFFKLIPKLQQAS